MDSKQTTQMVSACCCHRLTRCTGRWVQQKDLGEGQHEGRADRHDSHYLMPGAAEATGHVEAPMLWE